MNVNTETIPVLDELDIESFVREHGAKEKPKAQRYRFRVDCERFVTNHEQLTGAEVLRMAGKEPNCYTLYEARCGAGFVEVAPTSSVSFVAPGVERLVTLRKVCADG